MKEAIETFYSDYKVEDAQFTLLNPSLRMKWKGSKQNIIWIWKKCIMWIYLASQTTRNTWESPAFLSAGIWLKESDVTFQLMGTMETEEGEELDESKVYVSKTLSELLKIESGDQITFIHPITLEEYTYRIDGIAAINTQKAIYMTLNESNRFVGVEEGTYNGLYLKDKLDIPLNYYLSHRKGKRKLKYLRNY